MANFFKNFWVQFIAWCFIIIGTLVLILGGTSVEDIIKVPAYVVGIVEAVGLLIVFIKKMLTKKDTANK